MADNRDRRLALRKSAVFNGIDFVDVSADELTLKVHFQNGNALKGTVTSASIAGGERRKWVPVNGINDATDWSFDPEGRVVLTLTVQSPGDFSNYTLNLVSPKLDPVFDHVLFTFKAACEADLDCKPLVNDCTETTGPAECLTVDAAPPIDYLAKDFLSFRKALFDFSAQRYPRWHETSEADVGVMLLEVLAALGDELSYTQDRVATEATLATATQRRSLVRHARLVDYEPAPALAASVLLQFDVLQGPLPAGTAVSAQGADGTTTYFEVGTGLNDDTDYVVKSTWNRGLKPYFWDDESRCLNRDSTEMWVEGWGHGLVAGMQLLIETRADSPGDPALRQIVRLTPSKPGGLDYAVEEVDQLFGNNVTHIRWHPDDKLIDDRDLTGDKTVLAGNIVPATQGRRVQENFAIERVPSQFAVMPLAVTRLGPNSTASHVTPQYSYTLGGGRLAWVKANVLDATPIPEIDVVQIPVALGQVLTQWSWSQRLLDQDAFTPAYTIDPAKFVAIAQNSDQSRSFDYASDEGDTIRFGDGVFGLVPDVESTMQVRYRIANGAAGNVAADSITTIEPSTNQANLISVTNPFPSCGGTDQESDESLRRMAPQAFQARQYRAVRKEDYEAAAKRLSWVLNAGTRFRWTGSWLSIFTTADPRGGEDLSPDQRLQLIDLLNRYRLAGYESYVPDPHYVGIDVAITVCAQPDAFRADVKAALLERLSTKSLPDKSPAFFNPDQFTFGTPLERSRLEAAIQATPGISGVLSIQTRRRGVNANLIDLPEGSPVMVGTNEMLRVDNDPSRPEMGSVRVYVEGGK